MRNSHRIPFLCNRTERKGGRYLADTSPLFVYVRKVVYSASATTSKGISTDTSLCSFTTALY